MLDLCRLIIGMVIDLLRSRVALEADLEATNQRAAATPSQKTSVCTESSNPDVVVMKSAKEGV
jgi:hypothetical protein